MTWTRCHPSAWIGVALAGPGMGHDAGATRKRLDAVIAEVDAQTPTDEKWARSAVRARLVEDALDQEPTRPCDRHHDLGEVGFAGGEPPVRRCAAAAKASGVSAPPEQAPPAACCVGQQPGRRSAGSPRRMQSSRLPRRINACAIAVFRCRFCYSTAPFSWASPRLLRLASMP